MSQPPRAPRPRLQAFHPVPIRARADGWTPWRQAEFIGVLAQTGSVSAAARFVGRARETAYRLRRKPGAEGFAAAWDRALAIHAMRTGNLARIAYFEARTGPSPKVTAGPSWRDTIDGLWRPILRRGIYVGSEQKPDTSALLGYLAQLDRSFKASQKELRAELRSHTQTGAGKSDAGAVQIPPGVKSMPASPSASHKVSAQLASAPASTERITKLAPVLPSRKNG